MKNSVFASYGFALFNRFRRETRGALSVELVLVLPLVIWALLATQVYFDAFRKKMLAQNAAFHVADVISRKTDIVTPEYLEGMNQLLDFLAQNKFDADLRVSALMWDSFHQRPAVIWSYGADGMAPLPLDTFEYLSTGNYEEFADMFDSGWERHRPNKNLPDRVPPILPGEMLIMVESLAYTGTKYSDIFGMGLLGNQRLDQVAIVRPRLTPIINFSGVMEDYPDDDVYDGGSGINDEPDVPEDPVANAADPFEEPDQTLPGSTVVYENNFASGDRKDWSEVPSSKIINSNTPGLGHVIGLFGGETRTKPVRYSVNLGHKDNQSALIEFDLVLVDGWAGYPPGQAHPEGDVFMLMVGGRSIAAQSFKMSPTGRFAYTRKTVSPRGEGVFTTVMRPVNTSTNVLGGSQPDQIWRVTVLVENPKEKFELGFAARLNGTLAQKSFAIANMRISAVRGKYNGNAWQPRDGDRHHDDPFDAFPVYKDCLEPRLGSKTHSITNSDLSTPLRYRVRARGDYRVRYCTQYRDGYIFATPTATIDYRQEGMTGPGNRLRIRTEDGNRGFSCDAILVIRDPHGDLLYSGYIVYDNGPNDDWNALVNLGNAASGVYTIWVGTWYKEFCNADLVIEKY